MQQCKGNFVLEDFEIEIDGVKVGNREIVSSVAPFVMNGKYTGAGMAFCPFACINDGLLDICWTDHPDYQTLMGVAGLLTEAKKGVGTQAYNGKSRYMRGRKVKMTFKGRPGDPPDKVYGQQLICIDGENLKFDKFVVMEAIPHNIEVMFDSESYFKEFNSFVPQKNDLDK